MSFLRTTFKLITGAEPKPSKPRLHKLTTRDLIRMESAIGAQVFGAVPAGHRREFFCLDTRTWIWYEQWLDTAGNPHELTTRYEIHPNGILKVQDGHPYATVEDEELRNLTLAIKLYRDRVMREIYRRDPLTGKQLAAT